MTLGVALLADAEALHAMEPGKGSLDDPTVATQVRARLDLAARDARRDVPQTQTHTNEREVVRLVGVHLGRPPTRSTARSLDGRDGVDERERDVRVVDVRRGQDLGEGVACAIDD